MVGTVSDFDVNGHFGLISADDGQLLLFNLNDTAAELRDLFKVGARAEFAEREINSIARAVALVPIKPVIRE